MAGRESGLTLTHYGVGSDIPAELMFADADAGEPGAVEAPACWQT